MKVTLYDFYQTHCGPCKMMNPIVEQITEDYADSIEVIKINLDDKHDVDYKDKYQLMSTPTFVIEKDGEVVDRKSGFYPYEVLTTFINSHL